MGWYRFLPLVMVAMNLCLFVFTLVTEYRIKPNTLRFAFLYAMTVPAAMRGNLDPFLAVLTQPAV